ncbi:MAG: TIGR01777 family oxidoreductase [Bacteroidia bacterium]
MNQKNILITGATGLIGSALSLKLKEIGYTPIILSTTRSDSKSNIYRWDPILKICNLLPHEPYLGVINLAGASIADTKWNNAGKELIKQSRIGSTLYLKNVIDTLPNSPRHIISASAIGYYGVISDEIKTETSANGRDFAALVCRDWENAAHTLETADSKLSILRMGIVLAKDGGFYKKIKDLAKWKIASPIGTGKQPVCWIHVDDLVNVFIDILEEKLKPGIYNTVAATNTNAEVTKFIAIKNGQPFLWPAIPSFLLKLIFGKKAEIFTKSPVISNSKLLAEGYSFKFNDLTKAITNL